ncbi:MAG: hypothetical protein U1E50_08880 [Caulobacteraceae bacterium]
MSQPEAQALLTVLAPVAADAGPRDIDRGDIILTLPIVPGPSVKLLAAPDANPGHGPEGAILWPVRTITGLVYCWRAPEASGGLLGRPFYCFRDTDADGLFDQLFESHLGSMLYGGSQFLIRYIGEPERLRTPTPYAPTDARPAYNEIIAFRYDGPASGLASADNRLAPAKLEFVVLAGPDRESLRFAERVVVVLGANGRGRLWMPNGVSIDVLEATSDGRARVQVTGTLPAGNVNFFEPPTDAQRVDIAQEREAASAIP